MRSCNRTIYRSEQFSNFVINKQSFFLHIRDWSVVFVLILEIGPCPPPLPLNTCQAEDCATRVDINRHFIY